jgi:hypothetical protein
MRGLIAGLLVLLVVGYLGLQLGSVYRTKRDLEERVEHFLEFIDDPVATTVRQSLVRDAKELGIELVPENIHIVCRDTEELTLPQRLVGARLAQFTNKQVGISIQYTARILGFPLPQEITRGKIKQIEVRHPAPNPTNQTSVGTVDMGE